MLKNARNHIKFFSYNHRLWTLPSNYSVIFGCVWPVLEGLKGQRQKGPEPQEKPLNCWTELWQHKMETESPPPNCWQLVGCPCSCSKRFYPLTFTVSGGQCVGLFTGATQWVAWAAEAFLTVLEEYERPRSELGWDLVSSDWPSFVLF